MQIASETLKKIVGRLTWELTWPALLFSVVLLFVWFWVPYYYHKHKNNQKICKTRRQSYLATILLTVLLLGILIPYSIGTANSLKLAKADLQNQNFTTYTGTFWINDTSYSKYELYDKWASVELLDESEGSTYLQLYVQGIGQSWLLERGAHHGTVIYATESGYVVYFEDQ